MIRTASVQSIAGGEQVVNVLNWAGTAADIDEVLDRLEVFWNAVKEDLADAWALDRLDAGAYVTPSSAPTSASRIVGRGFTDGEQATTPLPPQVALVISMRGAGGFGRANRGRMYLGGFPASRQESVTGPAAVGRPDPGMMNRIATAFGTLIGPSTNPVRPVVKQSGSLVQNVVEEAYIDNRWDTQRRRARDIPRTARVTVPIS